ncbi:hypothetical protein FACS189430_08890 [Bacteroidia bacterium]|nr:hypothetical protein FACS189430_08890 [Bacteroidia bacterium]
MFLLHFPVVVEIVLSLVVAGIVVLIYVSKKNQQNLVSVKNQRTFIQQKAQILQQYGTLEEKRQSILKEHDELELTHRTKTQLFQVISGDIGNPLLALQNKLRVLLSENIEDTKFKAEVIELSQVVSDISLLLENLLQWSKYHSQTQHPNPQFNDLSALVQEAISSLKFAAAEKQITLDSNIEENLQIYADSDMFKALLKTILQNAISLLAKESAIVFAASLQDNEIKVQLRGEMPLQELFLQTFSGKEYNSNQSDAGKSFSLGWMFCKSVIANNQGAMSVNKVADNIVEILIQLPL